MLTREGNQGDLGGGGGTERGRRSARRVLQGGCGSRTRRFASARQTPPGNSARIASSTSIVNPPANERALEIRARAEAVLMMSDQWTEAFAFTGADALSNMCIQVEASAPSVSRV